MVLNVVVIIAILLLLLGVILIFNARWIVKNKFKSKNENKKVKIVKVLGFIISAIALVLICCFK